MYRVAKNTAEPAPTQVQRTCGVLPTASNPAPTATGNGQRVAAATIVRWSVGEYHHRRWRNVPGVVSPSDYTVQVSVMTAEGNPFGVSTDDARASQALPVEDGQFQILETLTAQIPLRGNLQNLKV